MIETLTLTTLCVLYLIFFRPGKTPVLENPLVIDRLGQYRISIAPQLNLAQPFVEAVGKRLAADTLAQNCTQECSFAVYDKQAVPREHSFYWLVAAIRKGRPELQVVAAIQQNTPSPASALISDNPLAQAIQQQATEFGLRVELRALH